MRSDGSLIQSPSVSVSVLAGFRSSKTCVFMEVSDLHLNGVGSDQHSLSSAGAATGIIFVATKTKTKNNNTCLPRQNTSFV